MVTTSTTAVLYSASLTGKTFQSAVILSQNDFMDATLLQVQSDAMQLGEHDRI